MVASICVTPGKSAAEVGDTVTAAAAQLLGAGVDRGDAGDADDAGYLLKTYNQPCNSIIMSAFYATMNSDAG